MDKAKPATPRPRHKQSFVRYLHSSLESRRKNNPKFSLRAFARVLEISPSSLSEILNGKRPLTEKMKLKMGWRLGLSQKELSRLTVQPYVDYSHYPQPHLDQLSADAFAAISDWYHFAILELTRVKGFQSTSESAAEFLGIPKKEAEEAVARLFRLGLLVENENGQWVNTYNKKGFITNIDPKQTSEANKKMVKQILEKSATAVDRIDVGLRNHTGITMAINKQDLAMAIEKIAAFRRGLCTELERTRNPDSLYQLHIGLFPLTKEQRS